MSDSTDPGSWWKRPRVAAVALGAVALVAAIAIAISLALSTANGTAGPSNSSSGAAPSGSPSESSPEGSPTPTPTALDGTGATGTPAPVDEEVDAGDGITISIAELTAVEGEPEGPGEVAGPAVRVLLTITNSTGAPVDLSAAVVNLYFGADNAPAVPVSGPDAFAFPAEIAAGDTVQGAYVFTVPDEDRDSVTIVVEYAPGVEPVAFQGVGPH